MLTTSTPDQHTGLFLSFLPGDIQTRLREQSQPCSTRSQWKSCSILQLHGFGNLEADAIVCESMTSISSKSFDLSTPNQPGNHIPLAEILRLCTFFFDSADEIATQDCSFTECIGVECLYCFLQMSMMFIVWKRERGSRTISGVLSYILHFYEALVWFAGGQLGLSF